MKFSELWLRERVNPAISTEALAEQLTMLGMEVEQVSAAAPDLQGVVAGRVESIEKHPNADKLLVCTVKKEAGPPVTVVTGAPGVSAGRCYPYAAPGVVLPGSAKIRETRIRGIKSAGMLCSAAELGLSEEADELFLLSDDAGSGHTGADNIRPGAPLGELIRTDERIFEVALTPNRGDCLSIDGIAREIAALNRIHLTPVDIQPVAAVHEQVRAIELVAAEACPRYAGRIIGNIDISRPAPLWLREKLRACGLRSLNAVVDITNYVMLELGQPMHAFDNDRLSGDIAVRYAAEGEKLTLLDGATRVMPASTLVIADTEQAVAMAGVMGGLDSAVTARTRHIFLESAFFSALAIAGRARQTGLNSEASHRFERGVDFTLQRRAMERATALVLDICGGEPGPITEAVAESALPPRRTVSLGASAVRDLLGASIDMEQCAGMLTRLGLEEAPGEGDSRRFTVPPRRFDITIEADLIEEIARLHGYQNIVAELPPASLGMRAAGARERLHALRQALVRRGYQEAVTYSFVSHELQSALFPELEGIALLNAISADMERMRVSLWPGLLMALRHNINRQQQRVRLFETGKVFIRDDEIRQELTVGGLSYGRVLPEQWRGTGDFSDFYHIKSDAEAVLSACCAPVSPDYAPASIAALHSGKGAEIIYDDRRIGLMGALHPAIQSRLALENEVYLFEIYLQKIPDKLRRKFTKISKFPVVRRDLSVLVDAEIPVENLLKNVRITASPLLTELELLDVYQGEPVASGKKSVTLGLTFQEISDTLTDEEVDNAVKLILSSLQKDFDAQLRG